MTTTQARAEELRFTWESPSCRLVLFAVLDALVEFGYDGLTLNEIRCRSGSAARGLDASVDLEGLLVLALQHVRLFPSIEPTGSLRDDLQALLRPWLHSRSRDERAIAAVLSAAEWNPRISQAAHEALDRPLAQAVATVLAPAIINGQLPGHAVQTVTWILRSLTLDRLRTAVPRKPVDLDRLIDFLLAPLQAGVPFLDSAESVFPGRDGMGAWVPSPRRVPEVSAV